MNHLTSIVKKVRTLTGFRAEEAAMAFEACCAAIVEELKEGEIVTLRGLGALKWKIAAARTIPERRYKNGGVAPAQHLPERPILKFVMAQSARHKFVGVEPKKIVKCKPWSDERKKKNEAS